MHAYRKYTSELQQTLDRLPFDQIDRMVRLLHSARMSGNQVFTIGNGGSASTATHMACDLAKNLVAPNLPRLRALALTDNVATLSAYANDDGYENVFAEQLATYVQEGDILVAISASGNSENVLRAVELAHKHGARTIGWSGYNGGRLAQIVQMPIVVRNHCIEQIEDVHLMLEHMTVVALRDIMQEELQKTSQQDHQTDRQLSLGESERAVVNGMHFAQAA